MRKPNAPISSSPDPLNIKLFPATAHLRPKVPERRNLAAREMLVRRIRAEFEEMPGLFLTVQQAARLFGLAPDTVSRILRRLGDEGVLHMRTDRCYTLRGANEWRGN